MTITGPNKEILFSDKIKENKEAFINKLILVSNNLGIDPNWLMLVFYIETAAVRTGVINHKARNPKTNAIGLIQFMPSTAKDLGTTTKSLEEMSNVDQLTYVQRYLSPYAGKIKSYVDCYLAVFFPLAIGKPKDWVLQTRSLSAEKIARFNPLYDINKDNKITVGEIEQKVLSFIPKNYMHE